MSSVTGVIKGGRLSLSSVVRYKAGALTQSWYWLLCASVAAQKDLSPVFAGEWKLPIADETRAVLGRIDWKRKDLTLKEVAEAVTPVWNGSDTAKRQP